MLERALAVARERLLRRGRRPGVRTAKTTIAAVAAYLAGHLVTGDPRPVLAALTALLVVQLTLYETVRNGLQRVAAVVCGVLLAVGLSVLVGLTWWSLGLIVAVALVVGRLLRLGDSLLEVPISAMLVLAVGGAHVAADARVVETLVGAGVGVAVSALLAPPLYVQPAGDAVGEFADRLAALLGRIADEVADPWEHEVARRWLEEARAIGRSAGRAERALARADASLRLNPRGRRAGHASGSLHAGLGALEHVGVAVREVCRTLADQAVQTGRAGEGASPYDEQVRRTMADLLRACAAAVGAFGRLVGADVRYPTPDDGELRAALERARQLREQLLGALVVDPREDPGGWELHGGLLVAVNRMLHEVDPRAGSEARAVPRGGRPPRRRADHAVRDMLASRRRVLDPRRPRPRMGRRHR